MISLSCYLPLCLLFLLSSSSVFSDWEVRPLHQSDGFKCVLKTWSGYQEASPTERDRLSLNLIVESLDPLSFELELESGIKSSLKHVGFVKIDEHMFVLGFNGSTGCLQDRAEKQLLIDSFLTAEKMPVVYGRKGVKLVFYNFRIRAVEKMIPELRSACSFLG